MKNIYAAFVKAQSEFGPALKQSNNPHFRSHYADLQSVTDAVGLALNANGLAYTWRMGFEPEAGWVVTCAIVHAESGEELTCQWPVLATKNDAQGFASGSTYARRYSLMAVCGVAPEDDDGNAASAPAPAPAARQAPAALRWGQPTSSSSKKAAAYADAEARGLTDAALAAAHIQQIKAAYADAVRRGLTTRAINSAMKEAGFWPPSDVPEDQLDDVLELLAKVEPS
jgi:hypothetical protein